MAPKHDDYLMHIVAEAFNPNNPLCVTVQLQNLDSRIDNIEKMMVEGSRKASISIQTKLAVVTIVATVLSTIAQPIIGAVLSPQPVITPHSKETSTTTGK
jgi:hypothetical protein